MSLTDLLISFSVAASTSAPLPQQTVKLPELPEYASGVMCTASDGIDRTNRDFMRGKLDKLIQSGEIHEDGWKLVARAYRTVGIATHNNFEMLNPKGEMVASLDTLQINRKTGNVMGYVPWGQYAAHTLDDCIPGNITVAPENRVGETILLQGKGTDALLGFAKAAERAVEHSKRNYDYKLLSVNNDGIEVNSNTFARPLAKIFERDIYPQAENYTAFGAPGLDVDLTKQAAGYASSFYKEIKQPEHIVQDPKYYEKFLADLKALHPNSQQETALRHQESRDKPKPSPFADGPMWR